MRLQHEVIEAKGEHPTARYPERSELEEAEQLQRDVVTAMELDPGTDHPLVLTSRPNLASTYWIHGNSPKQVLLRAQMQ